MPDEKGRILFVVNSPDFFLSHRLPIALEAKLQGYDVHVATAYGPDVVKIEGYGLKHHKIHFSRSGHNPAKELMTIFSLMKLYISLRPSLVHLVTIKPVLYGGLVARLTRVKSVVFAISGLGTVYLSDSTFSSLRTKIVENLYRIALKQNQLAVIFQNPDDRKKITSIAGLSPTNTYLIPGSGVALTKYKDRPEPNGTPVVLMVARLLKDKGVYEFVNAARVLRHRSTDVKMRIMGSPDFGNTTTLSYDDIHAIQKEGFVEFLGFCDDIASEYAKANIACLPSYREGLPKSLIEAAACGRAIVTTNTPGCRDAIIPNETGLLVPVRDSVALANAIEKLVFSPDLRARMGRAGRLFAKREFGIEKVVSKHIQIYNDLTSKT